jgi:hypothetical protein
MRETTATTTTTDRRLADERPQIAGVVVRENDIETVKGIRAVALLFRGMAVLLLVLMAAQLFFGFTSTVPLSPGVILADAVRLIIFAGLLWGGGELAVLWVKSHYDIRAQRILTARIAYMLQQELGDRPGRAPVQ